MLWKEALLYHLDILCVQETYFAKGKAHSCQHKLFPNTFANADTKKNWIYYSGPFPFNDTT